MGGSAGCDPLDQASDIELAFREQAIRETQSRLIETHPDFDGKRCVDGGEIIPVARLRMGKIRCVHCQSVRERNSKLYRS